MLLLGTVLAAAAGDVRLAAVALLMLAVVPFVVVVRGVVDVAADPTSHNLWPLEVVFAGVSAVPAVGLGTLLAWLLRRLDGREARRDPR